MECRELSQPLHEPARAAAATGPRQVLLVVADAVHLDALQRAVGRLMPDAQVETQCDALDALLAALRRRTDLVVVDADLPDGTAASLARHFGRIAPAAEVMVFGEAPDDSGCAGCHPWSGLEAGIGRWLATAGRAQGARS